MKVTLGSVGLYKPCGFFKPYFQLSYELYAAGPGEHFSGFFDFFIIVSAMVSLSVLPNL